MSTGAGPEQRVFVVLNPIHRHAARGLDAVLAAAAATGRDVEVLPTTVAEPGREQARRALDAGARSVVVIGGDGTVRLVAGAMAGSGVPLGIVPTGTANLFARNLGLKPRQLARNARAALDGQPRALDVGWSRHRLGDAWQPDEPFLVVAGLGQDAATVAATPHHLKRRLRWLAYFTSGVRHLFAPEIGLTIAIDGRPARHLATWCVLAGNCGRLPFGVRVFPDAQPDDGHLDILLLPAGRRWRWPSAAAVGLLHVRRGLAALEYGRAHDLVITPDEPQPLQLDGDVVDGVTEAQWRVAASELAVRTGEGIT